jgi:hypothetical protein
VELVGTERLVLRHWAEADLAAFFDLYPGMTGDPS